MEHKFKVWCKNKNEWERDKCVLTPEGLILHWNGICFKPCNPKTHIAVFSTGLPDKNGKEIYEGHVLLINEHDDEWVDKVIRDKNWLELSKYKNHCVTNISLWEDHDKLKIIGNIYENPELLKES